MLSCWIIYWTGALNEQTMFTWNDNSHVTSASKMTLELIQKQWVIPMAVTALYKHTRLTLHLILEILWIWSNNSWLSLRVPLFKHHVMTTSVSSMIIDYIYSINRIIDLEKTSYSCGDYIEVYDGFNTWSTRLVKYCKAPTDKPFHFSSKSNKMKIVFQSNAQNHGKGFFASYITEDKGN